MIKLSELQMKEIIDIREGKRLGHLHDLTINPVTGVIESIIILYKQRKGSFFTNVEEVVIEWQHISKIGTDVILVNQPSSPPLYLESTRNNTHF